MTPSKLGQGLLLLLAAAIGYFAARRFCLMMLVLATATVPLQAEMKAKTYLAVKAKQDNDPIPWPQTKIVIEVLGSGLSWADVFQGVEGRPRTLLSAGETVLRIEMLLDMVDKQIELEAKHRTAEELNDFYISPVLVGAPKKIRRSHCVAYGSRSQ